MKLFKLSIVMLLISLITKDSLAGNFFKRSPSSRNSKKSTPALTSNSYESQASLSSTTTHIDNASTSKDTHLPEYDPQQHAKHSLLSVGYRPEKIISAKFREPNDRLLSTYYNDNIMNGLITGAKEWLESYERVATRTEAQPEAYIKMGQELKQHLRDIVYYWSIKRYDLSRRLAYRALPRELIEENPQTPYGIRIKEARKHLSHKNIDSALMAVIQAKDNRRKSH